jgi:putative lipase involved disintegration of autophagic bodies
MSKLSREMKTLAKHVGGSFKTVHDRIRIIDRFCRHLMALNIQVRDVQHLKTKHIESYIANHQATGITVRTLHNDMSALRAVFRLAGREKLVTSTWLTNRALGLSGASRAGTKFAIPNERFQEYCKAPGSMTRGLPVPSSLPDCWGFAHRKLCSAPVH